MLTDARLVGKDSFRPMPYETAPPHGGIVETLDGMLTAQGRHHGLELDVFDVGGGDRLLNVLFLLEPHSLHLVAQRDDRFL